MWLALPQEACDAELERAYADLLSPEEQRRHERFAFEGDRRRYLVTRAMLRSVLSRYVDVHPGRWTFRENAYGRPEISAPAGAATVTFNLAHTEGLIACLVGRPAPIGVDVEWCGRVVEPLALAHRFFAPSEAAALRATPRSRRRRRFLEYWTLKEAYAKARGRGLALPFDAFAFRLHETRPIVRSFAAELRDRPSAWQLRLARPSPQHVLALALWRGSAPPARIRWRCTGPLQAAAAWSDVPPRLSGARANEGPCQPSSPLPDTT